MPIPVAMRSKAWFFGRSLTRIVVSNPTGGMDVCVVFDVKTVIWNVSDMNDKEGFNTVQKWIKGEKPRTGTKKILPGAWLYFSLECCVLPDRVLCIRLITRPEEFYRGRVSECDRDDSNVRRPCPTKGFCALKNILMTSTSYFRKQSEGHFSVMGRQRAS